MANVSSNLTINVCRTLQIAVECMKFSKNPGERSGVFTTTQDLKFLPVVKLQILRGLVPDNSKISAELQEFFLAPSHTNVHYAWTQLQVFSFAPEMPTTKSATNRLDHVPLLKKESSSSGKIYLAIQRHQAPLPPKLKAKNLAWRNGTIRHWWIGCPFSSFTCVALAGRMTSFEAGHSQCCKNPSQENLQKYKTSWWFQPRLKNSSQIGSFPQGSG